MSDKKIINNSAQPTTKSTNSTSSELNTRSAEPVFSPPPSSRPSSGNRK